MVSVENSDNNKSYLQPLYNPTDAIQSRKPDAELRVALNGNQQTGSEGELNPSLTDTKGKTASGNVKGKKGADRTAQLKAASKEFASQNSDKISTVAEINEKYDTSTVPALKSSGDVSSAALTELKTKRSKAEADIKTAQQNYNNALTGNTEKMKAEKEKCDAKQKAYFDALDESKNKEVQELKEKIKETETNINKTEEEIKKYGAELSETETAISENSSQVNVVNKRISEYTKLISSLQSKASKAEEKDKAGILAQINATNNKKANAEADKKTLTERQTKLKEKQEELKSNKKKSEESLKTLKKEKEDYDKKIKACKDEKVKTALDEYNTAKADYQKLVEKNKSELKQLQDTLKEKRTELIKIDNDIVKEEQKLIKEKHEAETKAAIEQSNRAATSGGYSGNAGGGSEYVLPASGPTTPLVQTPVGDLNYDKNKKYSAEGLKNAWSSYGPASKLSLQFFQMALDLANELKCDPNDLLALMNSEGGFNPSAYDPKYGGGGLIGFMPKTAESMGTSVAALRQMSPEEQMKYVRECMLKSKQMAFGMDRELSGADLYSMNFLPAFAKNDVLTTKGSVYYSANSALDADNDGDIDKSDMAVRLLKKMPESAQKYRQTGNDPNYVSQTNGVSGVSATGGTATPYKIGNFDLSFWQSQGYNQSIGQQLAMDAVRTCPGKADGQCVGYTRKTLNRVFGTNFTNAGAAQNFGNKILSSPQLSGKFRKVNMSDVARAGIPDGAIVIWKGGVPGYNKGKAALYGHGGIAYNNRVYSDFVAKNLTYCAEVWIPV